jgi:hypothetical protein
VGLAAVLRGGAVVDIDAILIEVLQRFEDPPKNVYVSWVDLDAVHKDWFDENADWAACTWDKSEYKFIGLHPKLVRLRAPKYVLFYLIFHEVLHLVMPPHGLNSHHKFFRIAERLCPKYLQSNDWLVRHH